MLKTESGFANLHGAFACATTRTVVAARGRTRPKVRWAATWLSAHDPVARSIPVECGISTSIASVETLGPRSIRT